MGKMALMLVLGVTMTLGIIGYTLNSTKLIMLEKVVGFHKYTTARNIAHTGVNVVLRSLDRPFRQKTAADTALYNAFARGELAQLNVNIMAGTCTLTLKQGNVTTLDTVDLTSSSAFMDTTYRMFLRLRRAPKPFPGIAGAVSFADTGIIFDTDGKPKIHGENYDMDGSRGETAYDTIGLATKTYAESLQVVTELASHAGGASLISGDPAKLDYVPDMDDPGAYVQEYINGADIVFPNGSNNSGVYGSKTEPLIGYANGNVKFGGNGSFYGVLVVNGKLDMVGTFDIYGLVLCYGPEIEIEVSTSAGTPEVHGALIMSGAPGSRFTMKGTADMSFSYEAIQMAKYMPKLQFYSVMRWYE